jgi:hypothetical protein
MSRLDAWFNEGFAPLSQDSHKALKLTDMRSVTRGSASRERASRYDGSTGIVESVDTRKLDNQGVSATQRRNAAGAVLSEEVKCIGMTPANRPAFENQWRGESGLCDHFGLPG